MKNLRSILEVARALHSIAVEDGGVFVKPSTESAVPELEEATFLVQEVHENLIFEIQRVQAEAEKRRRPISDHLERQSKPQTDRIRNDEALDPSLKQQLTEISLRLERLEKRADERDAFVKEINRLGQRIHGMAQQIQRQKQETVLSAVDPAALGELDPIKIAAGQSHGTCFRCEKEIPQGTEFVVGDEGIRHVEGSLACR